MPSKSTMRILVWYSTLQGNRRNAGRLRPMVDEQRRWSGEWMNFVRMLCVENTCNLHRISTNATNTRRGKGNAHRNHYYYCMEVLVELFVAHNRNPYLHILNHIHIIASRNSTNESAVYDWCTTYARDRFFGVRSFYENKSSGIWQIKFRWWEP